MKNTKLINELNNALSLELRAIILYYIMPHMFKVHIVFIYVLYGSHKSIGHANIVRSAIVKLGGIAITEKYSKSNTLQTM